MNCESMFQSRRPWRRPARYIGLAAIGLLLVLQSPAFSEDWHARGNDPAGRRFSSETGLEPPFTELWHFEVPGGHGFSSSPAVADDKVFIASKNGKLYALHVTASRRSRQAFVAWEFQAQGPIAGSPTVSNGRVFIASLDGSLYGLEAETGNLLWELPTNGRNFSSACALNGMVVLGIGAPSPRVIGVDAERGTVLWTRPTQGLVHSSPASDGFDLFVTTERGEILCLDPSNAGTMRWSVDTEGVFSLCSPLVHSGRVYALPRGRHHVFLSARALDGLDLQWVEPLIPSAEYILPPWEVLVTRSGVTRGADGLEVVPCGTFLHNSWFSSSSFAVGHSGPDEVLLFMQGSSTIRLYAYRTADMTLKWETIIGNATTLSVLSTPAIADDLAFVGGVDSNSLYAINLLDGSIAQQLPLDGAMVSSPTPANGMLFAATLNGTLYAFDSAANRAPSAPDASTFSPSQSEEIGDCTPTISWNHALDPDPGGELSTELRYLVRYDFDGEVLYDWQEELRTGPESSTGLPANRTTISNPIPSGSHVTYRIRTMDSNRALSPWSAAADFWAWQPPDAPASVTALPFDGAVRVLWDPSPSASAVEYFLYYKLATESWCQATRLSPGNVFEQTVSGLANNVAYDFMVTAVEAHGFESPGTVASAVPRPPITINDDYSRGYATIAAAASTTAAGDTITLGIGTFVEEVTLPPRVSLKGYAAHLTVLDGGGAFEVLTVDTSGPDPGAGVIELLQLAITGGTDGIVFLEPSGWAAQVRIANVVLYGLSGDGIAVVHSSATVTVENITAANNGGSGLELRVPSAVLKSSVATRNGGYGFRYQSLGTGTGIVSRFNNAWGNGTGNYEGNSGIGCYSAPVPYLDEANGDYRLPGDAVTVDRGDPGVAPLAELAPNADRLNQGAFGGTPSAAPTAAPSPGAETLVGLGSGGGGWVEMLSDSGGAYAHVVWRRFPWQAYNLDGGETRPAAGDLNGNGRSDMVVGTGSYPANGGWLAVLHEGPSGLALLRWLRVPWQSYNAVNGETWPACGDVDGDGRDELVVGLGPGASGWWCLFDDEANWFAFLGWHQLPWSAYNTANGEVRPAVGDIDGDGVAEICLGLGPEGHGWLAMLEEAASLHALQCWRRVPWAAYTAGIDAESFPALGDVDGDGRAEGVVGLGPGSGGWVWLFEDAASVYASAGWLRLGWSAYNAAGGETRPACGDLDADGNAELVIGLASYPPSGGWLQRRDDAASGYASTGWIRVRWSAYNSTNGETRPATGNWR